MSKDPWSFLIMLNSLSKYKLNLRYAEIVNVRLGDGQIRKGQVLEICGKKAVVQVINLFDKDF